MGRLWGVLLIAALGSTLTVGQQTSTSAPLPSANSQPERVKVYGVGPGVTAPQLLPVSPIPIADGKCGKTMDRTAVLSVLVDTAGKPRNLMFLEPVGNDMDILALQIASADRFTPGTHDGAPAVVGQSLKIDLQGCADEIKEATGKKLIFRRLRSQPLQELSAPAVAPDEAVLAPDDSTSKEPDENSMVFDRVGGPLKIGGAVRAPIILHHADAVYSDAARKAKYEGNCLISLVVDRNGMPQNLRVVRGLDYGLDENAMKAARQYRFKPAMKDGEPVPVMISIEVSFRLY